jgi:hypothetical protein
MPKKIYITEEIAEKLSLISKPMSDIPADVKSVLKNHKTSLGIHPSFPPEEETSFDALITKERFNEVCEKVSLLNLDDYSPKTLRILLQNKIDKCKEIESNFKESLENICYNYIIDLFQVPEGLVAFKCSLVENVNDSKAQVDSKNDIQFRDIHHMTRLHDAVYKRRMINALITGGAHRLSFIEKGLIGELYELSPELPLLYREITILNDYLLFTKNNMGISDKNKRQSGISYLIIGDENTKNKLVVEAEIFPILLHESIKGFLEMFAAYGLPSSKKDCAYVISKADFINAEPWDMRLGPKLWDYLMDSFHNPTSNELPIILTILFSQGTEKFNSILQEIFGKTKRSKYLVNKILSKAQKEFNENEFNELMHRKQTDSNLINDSYFLAEEL